MIQEESQAVLTFYQRGTLAQKGYEISSDGKINKNAATKEEIRKMMAFSGAINPETGKYEKVLNVDWYIKNKKPFPKKYYWSKKKYVEPIYHTVTRKLCWTWEQLSAMLNSSMRFTEKQWNKLSDEQKIEMHALQCMQPGEYLGKIEYVN